MTGWTRQSIAQTIAYVANAHNGQTDKVGRLYVWHVLDVAARVANICPSDIELQHAALLHDIVEDGHATPRDLKRLGYSFYVRACVDALTRRKGETYSFFIQRVKASGDGPVIVKRCDIAANMARIHLLRDPVERLSLESRYMRALEALGDPLAPRADSE